MRLSRRAKQSQIACVQGATFSSRDLTSAPPNPANGVVTPALTHCMKLSHAQVGDAAEGGLAAGAHVSLPLLGATK